MFSPKLVVFSFGPINLPLLLREWQDFVRLVNELVQLEQINLLKSLPNISDNTGKKEKGDWALYRKLVCLSFHPLVVVS